MVPSVSVRTPIKPSHPEVKIRSILSFHSFVDYDLFKELTFLGVLCIVFVEHLASFARALPDWVPCFRRGSPRDVVPALRLLYIWDLDDTSMPISA